MPAIASVCCASPHSRALARTDFRGDRAARVLDFAMPAEYLGRPISHRAVRTRRGQCDQEAPQEDAKAQEAQAAAPRAPQAEALARPVTSTSAHDARTIGIPTTRRTPPSAARFLFAPRGVALRRTSCRSIESVGRKFVVHHVVFFGVSLDDAENQVLASAATLAGVSWFAVRRRTSCLQAASRSHRKRATSSKLITRIPAE